MMNSLELKISDAVKQFSKPIETKENYSAEEKKNLAKASVEFESLLTQMMLKSMNKTTEGMFGGEGFGGDIFEGLFQTELSKKMSRNQSMGVAAKIYKNITGEELDIASLSSIGSGVSDLSSMLRMGFQKDFATDLTPSINSMDRLNEYQNHVEKYSDEYNIEQSLIKSIILAESSAKKNAVSHANAKGLMQLIDSTAKEMGVKNVFNPEENIKGGTKYLSQLLEQFDGNVNMALAAYNAGPEAVKKHNGIPPYKETQNYVKKINSYIKYFEEND